jgi:hypothetical protein
MNHLSLFGVRLPVFPSWKLELSLEKLIVLEKLVKKTSMGYFFFLI